MTTLTLQPPTSPAAAATLERNLAAMGERHRELAEEIRNIPAAALEWLDTLDGDAAPSAVLDGRPLASRHRPLEEAQRLIENIDLVEHAVIVVLGFGLGHHVQALARRTKKAGLIVVFEPDLSLLRAAMERIDFTPMLRDSLVVFVHEAEDRGQLGRRLDGSEAIIAQGVHVLEHPASRPRIGESGAKFAANFARFVDASRTTLMTTLARAGDTIRNLVMNLDHYAGGGGAADLQNAAKDKLAVVVSAGPSARKNMHLLADPQIRDRCVIIAVQTMLKPLLAAGIRPHFITALDYHEISRRFYEGLTEDDVRGVTLLADPKVNPAVIDAFPGAVRCCSAGFLDRLLGEHKRPMGDLPAGATVAHLCLYLANFMGCNPIALIGQDLGFSDGLYYTPGTAIHDVWSTELNPFNTIAMMEWQRIARHRTHLQKLKDVHGRSIYTDRQMATYLAQFERDFARLKAEGVDVIDASEGGVAKQHARPLPLSQVMAEHAKEPLAKFSDPPRELDRPRLKAVADRVHDVRRETMQIQRLSRETAELLEKMLSEQTDAAKMKRHFEQIDRNRAEVARRMDCFDLVSQLNQLGVFKRLKADRRLHFTPGLAPREHQRAQLERDLANVRWIADASQELIDLLEEGAALCGGERDSRPDAKPLAAGQARDSRIASGSTGRFAALIAIQPPFDARLLEATLERLGQSQRVSEIVLIAPKDCDILSRIDRSRIGLPIAIETCDGSPFGREYRAVMAARKFSPTCWRGGIAGMSIYDEVLCPAVMNDVMKKRAIDAAVIVGPDWANVRANESGSGGCDALIERHAENPQQHGLVFTQAPPGLCGCLISAGMMNELSQRNRLSTVGGLLTYQPHAPMGDPIAREANVQIDHTIRGLLGRFTGDGTAIEDRPVFQVDSTGLPRHVILELTTQRISRGLFAAHPCGIIRRPPISLELACRIFDQVAERPDAVVTFDGAGDPLLHDSFDAIISQAKQRGICGIHVRTELLTGAGRATIDRLLDLDVDVISVDLHADRAATYQAMMGFDRFKEVLTNIEYVLNRCTKLTNHAGTAGFAIPWLVPRLQRRAETLDDMDSFFDRWQHLLGTAVIESSPWDDDTLTPAVTPARVIHRELSQRMTILSDGSVPVGELDLAGRGGVGNAGSGSLKELWQAVLQSRKRALTERGREAVELKVFRP